MKFEYFPNKYSERLIDDSKGEIEMAEYRQNFYLEGYEFVKHEMAIQDDGFANLNGQNLNGAIITTVISIVLGFFGPEFYIVTVIGIAIIVYCIYNNMIGGKFVPKTSDFLGEMETVTEQYYANYNTGYMDNVEADAKKYEILYDARVNELMQDDAIISDAENFGEIVTRDLKKEIDASYNSSYISEINCSVSFSTEVGRITYNNDTYANKTTDMAEVMAISKMVHNLVQPDIYLEYADRLVNGKPQFVFNSNEKGNKLEVTITANWVK